MSLDNSLETLVFRKLSERGTIDEHEALWFVSDAEMDEPVHLEVFCDEGSVKVSSEVEIGLEDFFETVESWYTVSGRDAETLYLEDEEWYRGRPEDIISGEHNIRAFDFHFYRDFDPFSMCWTDHSDHDVIGLPDEQELSVTFYHDNANPYPELDRMEPLRTVLPEVLNQNFSEEAVYQVIGDLTKYLNSPRHYTYNYHALLGFEEDAIQHYFENQMSAD